MVFLMMLAMAVSAFAAPKKCMRWLTTSTTLVLPLEKEHPADDEGTTGEFRCSNIAVAVADSPDDAAFLPSYTTSYLDGAAEAIRPGFSYLPYSPPRLNAVL